jgi:hypothetical protein
MKGFQFWRAGDSHAADHGGYSRLLYVSGENSATAKHSSRGRQKRFTWRRVVKALRGKC